MKRCLRLFLPALVLCNALRAEPAGSPKPPAVTDPRLRVECVAIYPDVEACTTVAGGPDGSIYIGNDPRDARLNTAKPECTIVRYSGSGPDRKRTVFATGLYSPAGMLWHDGWLYVMHDPLLSRFKDTKGAGVADVREDLVTSLGLPPNEGLNDHVVSGLAMGMDGMLYISAGDRGIHNAKGTDGTLLSLWGGGIVRCRPDGTALEIFSGGTRNHLEVDLDAMDHAFTNDNTDDGNGWWTRVTQQIESGYYGYPFYYRQDESNGLMKAGPLKPQSDPGALPVNELFLPAMTDFGGGSPTGGLCYMSDGLPEEYRGKLLFSEWGRGMVFRTDVEKEGATFRFAKETPLLSAKGIDFRPMELSVAADGSLLVADWQWGGWKGNKTVGAVWRVSWPDAKSAARIADESKASASDLVAALGHVDRDQRLRAEWELSKRGDAVVPDLIAAMHVSTAPAVKRAHALWALDLAGNASADLRSKASGLIRQMLADGDPALRAQAIKALALRQATEAAGEIVSLLKDADGEVRMQAAIALGRMRVKSAAPGLLALFADEDRWVRFASRVAFAKIGDWPLLAPALNGQDSRVREQAWLAIGSVYDEGALTLLGALTASPDAGVRAHALAALGHAAYLPKPYDGGWWGTQPVKNRQPASTVAWAGSAPALKALIAGLADADASVRIAAAAAFEAFSGGRDDKLAHEASIALRARLTAETEQPVRKQLIEVLGARHDPEAMGVFISIALDEKADPEFRTTAIVALSETGGDGAKAAIAQLAASNLSRGALLPVIQAAARLRVVEASAGLIGHLKDADAAVREASIKALAAIGAKSNATGALIEALSDKEGAVQREAANALGTMRAKESLPKLIALYEQGKSKAEALRAIASMADASAIPTLLSALSETDAGTRRAALKALKAFRVQTWPLIQERIATGKISKELEGEVRSYFESGVIQKWTMIGPFENVWEAVHPPEKDALANGGKPELAKKYVNAEGHDAGWKEQTGDAESGHLNLEKIYQTNGMVCAYAYTEFNAAADADAKLLCGSDDQIAIWINGKKVHDVSGSRSYEADKDTVSIHLMAGLNRLFVKIGNNGGAWEFAVRIPGLDNGMYTPATGPRADEKQRAYALASRSDGAWEHAGNPGHGERLFYDPAASLGGICATCHAVRGKGGQVGPDLTAIAVNYKRPDLVTSILEPSKTIALGFEQVLIETKGGDIFGGVLRSDAGEELKVVGADGLPHIIKRTEIKKRTDVKTSLMPEGITLGLKPEDFVDLVAYLETLHGA